MDESDQRPRLRYRRVILKLSGESMRDDGSGESISPEMLRGIARQVREVHELGVEMGLVIGGGNIWRGLPASERGMDRATADSMGMLATVINGLALQSYLEQAGLETRLQTAIDMKSVAEPFIRRRAIRHLERGRIVIFAAGTGHPFFSTDTAAALRANEIGAEALLKATKVDGVYDRDPARDPGAVRYEVVSHGEALARRLRVMDSTALSLCMDNHMPIIVFDMRVPNNIKNAVLGHSVGTLVLTDTDDRPTPEETER